MKRLILPLLILLVFSCSCKGLESQKEREIKTSFTSAMKKYHQIWKTPNTEQAEDLANEVFSDKDTINQVLYSHRESLKRDLGVSITNEKYNISVLKFNNKNATLRVRATLKGYPISISSGQKKINQKQDFSFGPHDFEMIKEQGRWKISQF